MESPESGPIRGGFFLAGCNNVTIRNIVIDWDSLPFTQGRILAVDADTREVVFKPDPGYEFIFPQMRKDSGSLVRLYVFDKATRKLSPYQVRMGVRGVAASRGVFERANADGSYLRNLNYPAGISHLHWSGFRRISIQREVSQGEVVVGHE